MNMENNRRRGFYEKLARTLFKCGDIGTQKCNRIQFMVGKWPNEEKPNGGLCEASFADMLQEFFEE